MNRSNSSLIDSSVVQELCSKLSKRHTSLTSMAMQTAAPNALRFSVESRPSGRVTREIPKVEPRYTLEEIPAPRLATELPGLPESPFRAGSLSESTEAEFAPSHTPSSANEGRAIRVLGELVSALVDTTTYTPQEVFIERLNTLGEALGTQEIFLADEIGLPITTSSSDEESIVFGAALLTELERWRPMNVFDGSSLVVERKPGEYMTLLFVRGQVETFIVGLLTTSMLEARLVESMSALLSTDIENQ